MVNIYLLENFNNYYNREIKKPNSLNDYLEASNLYYVAQNQQFKLADGVNTTYILNLPETSDDCSFVDYLLAVNQSGEIETRWFVLEQHKTREKQYQLVLRRDLIADFLEPFKNAAIYLEKGYITNPSNPLIYNQENFTANQIKQDEIEIKDPIGLKWIVGYVNKNSLGYVADKDGNTTQTTREYTSYVNKAYTPDITVNGLSNWQYYGFVNGAKKYATYVNGNFDYYNYNMDSSQGCFTVNIAEHNATETHIPNTSYRGNIGTYRTILDPTFENEGFSYNPRPILNPSSWTPKILKDEANTRIGGTNKETYEAVKALKGQILFDGSKYYKISLTETPAAATEVQVILNSHPTWYNAMYNLITELGMESRTPSGTNFRLTFTWSPVISIQLTEVYNEGYKVAIDGEKHNRTVNEAYDMFAIPVIDKEIAFNILNGGGVAGPFRSTNYNSAFAIGQALTEVAAEAIDLQLLPFCPLPYNIWKYDDGTYHIDLDWSKNDIEFDIIKTTNDTAVNMVFFLSNNEFSRLIPYTDTNDYSTPEKVKEINQLVSYRLCAGDYSSAFEFNPAKNGGISYFEVDCKYKPFAPYIHVAPNFGNLYGRDYNDTRGLVCSNTNYSLSRGTDAWATYERNNLNYNNAFNRQIENMEVQRDYQRRQEVAQAFVGGLQGGSTGGLIGSAGGPYGAIAGAAIGGITSAALGALDIQYSDALYKENKQYTIDQFNMSLENIRALPNTLVATGAQNPNNKVFPVLEIYSCSNVEKEAFQKKLKWNGMTIGVITETIGDYLKPTDKTYVKGQLIYINDTFNPYKASEIANELAKGLLIEGGII